MAQIGLIGLGTTGANLALHFAEKGYPVAVFNRTPAKGVLEVGDRITGANGRKFTTPHKFGYGMDKFGPYGPILEFANALEAH